MNYPLQLSFKLIAINTQVYTRDATGNLALYIKQKAFRLKEDITVFADEAQTRPLYHIKADRIIDFSARYTFTDTQGNVVGAIRRQGMKSLWKSHYDVLDRNDQIVATIQEENPWIKVLDSVVGEIPVVGMFTGYMFHPAYILARGEGNHVLRLVKKPSIMERRYEIEQRSQLLSEDEEIRSILSLMLVVLMERAKG